MRRLIALATVAVITAAVVVIAVAGGGSDQSSAAASAPSGYSRATPAPNTNGGSGAVVSLRKTALGSTLVDAGGRSLYLFEGRQGRHEQLLGRLREHLVAAVRPGRAARRRRRGRGQARHD